MGLDEIASHTFQILIWIFTLMGHLKVNRLNNSLSLKRREVILQWCEHFCEVRSSSGRLPSIAATRPFGVQPAGLERIRQ